MLETLIDAIITVTSNVLWENLLNFDFSFLNFIDYGLPDIIQEERMAPEIRPPIQRGHNHDRL